MDIYLVGGAVRDELLNLPVIERDWVVVGSTQEEMLAHDFIQVGKDFPVFLHPKTREEYALARTERKSGRGYKGFTVYAAPEVTLEQDLQRRDLTINAIAKDVSGRVIDPFSGQKDLKDKILRHVSPAFMEDPLRVLRVARFAARFADFTIAPETLALMQQIVNEGEIEHLVPERAWVEVEKALREKSAWIFFEVLQQCGALNRLFNLPHSSHQQIVLGIKYLKEASLVPISTQVKFAVFSVPFLKSYSLSQYSGHLKLPNSYKQLLSILITVEPHYRLLQRELVAENIMVILEKLDAFRRPQQVTAFLECMSILDKEMAGTINPIINKSAEMTKKIDIDEIKNKNLSGTLVKEWIRSKRLALIKGNLV